MKFELPALQSEPLIYFLLHSGVFVLILSALFFAIGLWFGALTWRKYKRQSKATHEENQALLREIAILKRKLAEQSLRPTMTAAATTFPPAQVLPHIRDISPEQQTLQPVPTSAPTPPTSVPQAFKAALPTLESGAEADFVRPAIGSALEPAEETKITRPPTKPRLRTRAKQLERGDSLLATAEPKMEVEPFGFLLEEPSVIEPPTTVEAPTTLHSIIQGKPSSQSPNGVAKMDKTAKVKLPSAPPQVTTAEPEMGPEFGPIYREVPPTTDDLTKIKGITEILAKRLHDLGVHTFHQMASWDESHVREFSNQLAFKDRITREGWVDQARALDQARTFP